MLQSCTSRVPSLASRHLLAHPIVQGGAFLCVCTTLARAQSVELPKVPPAVTAEAKAEQTKTPAPELRQDLADLARVLATAHGIDAGAPEIRSFRAQIGMEPRQEHAIAFEVQVDFLAPRALRCESKEKGAQVARGFDPKLGAWAQSNGETVKVQGPEHNLEAEEVERELRLCQQLIRFLNPSRLLAGLKEAAPVRQGDLEITKRLGFAGCTIAEGTLASIPTYALGTDGPARVSLYLHPQTKQLLAVQAVPLQDDGKPGPRAELVLLGDYGKTQGIALPTRLNVYRLAGAERELLVTVHIRGIDLGIEFGAAHFARPRPPTK